MKYIHVMDDDVFENMNSLNAVLINKKTAWFKLN
jgi:hypothetical protein